MSHRIVHVRPDAGTLTVELTWTNGAVTVKDMAPLIATRRLFIPLADPVLFDQVHVIDNGRAIAWTDEIDSCADALWYDAHPEDNPFAEQSRAAE